MYYIGTTEQVTRFRQITNVQNLFSLHLFTLMHQRLRVYKACALAIHPYSTQWRSSVADNQRFLALTLNPLVFRVLRRDTLSNQNDFYRQVGWTYLTGIPA